MGPRNLEKTVEICQFWGILDVFSLISQPPYTFFNFWVFYWVCVFCAVILNTKKKSLKGRKNCVFFHFSQRRWNFEISLFINMSYFCVLYPAPLLGQWSKFWPVLFLYGFPYKVNTENFSFLFCLINLLLIKLG